MSIARKLGQFVGRKTGFSFKDSTKGNRNAPIRCKFCKSEMHDDATHCPACGRRNNMGGYGGALIAVMLVAILVTMCKASAAESYSPAHDAVLNHFKTNEPTTKDAIWTTAGIFKIGVIDNGKSRDGYALYACEVLKENGLATGTWVQIIDIVKLTRHGKWGKLGEARCQ